MPVSQEQLSQCEDVAQVTEAQLQDEIRFLVKHWPLVMTRLTGLDLTWPEEATSMAVEFFQDQSKGQEADRNRVYLHADDIVWICLKAYLASQNNPDEDFRYFNCQRYATNPCKMLTLNCEDEYRIARMYHELLKHDNLLFPLVDDFWTDIDDELVRVGKEPFGLEAQPKAQGEHYIAVDEEDYARRRESPMPDDNAGDEDNGSIAAIYSEAMQRLGLDLTLPSKAVAEAAEFVNLNPEFTYDDIVAICVLGAVAALENPPPAEDKLDPFLYCANFSLSPGEVFGCDGHNVSRLVSMVFELNYEPLDYASINNAIEQAVRKVTERNWFGPLKDLAQWQAEQAELRRKDPRRHNPFKQFECL